VVELAIEEEEEEEVVVEVVVVGVEDRRARCAR
jgi:hypothetical protein